MTYLLAAAIGLVSGITSGLFGVGGGLVMVPAIMFFMGMDIKRAVGTSLAVIIPTALTTTFKHAGQGNVNWHAALALAPAAIVGGYFGAWLTKHIDSTDLKRIFGGFVILVGLRLLFFK
jgi:uncharacterized protein